ncbi:DUF3347 domain-containing protein [Flavobacterium sp. XGLA_31]|uniref:DUF3347 domain-containing protein n=1 Tax=Flavobacterium sp. XGLA_31 TaxID=3447666 RepID=UPI003F305EBE
MKTIIFSITTMVLGFLSFTKSQNENRILKNAYGTAITQTRFSTNEVVSSYLKIKNALVKSDSNTASESGEALIKSLNEINTNEVSAIQKTLLTKITDEAKKQAKTISTSKGKLDKQRKAFQELSKNINELVSTFGTSQKLYLDFCPMYEGGSIWLSETKEIKNPYYGAQMLVCGKLKETIEK